MAKMCGVSWKCSRACAPQAPSCCTRWLLRSTVGLAGTNRQTSTQWQTTGIVICETSASCGLAALPCLLLDCETRPVRICHLDCSDQSAAVRCSSNVRLSADGD